MPDPTKKELKQQLIDAYNMEGVYLEDLEKLNVGPKVTDELFREIQWLDDLIEKARKNNSLNTETMVKYSEVQNTMKRALASIIGFQGEYAQEFRLRAQVEYLEGHVDFLASRLNEFTTCIRLRNEGDLKQTMELIDQHIERKKKK